MGTERSGCLKFLGPIAEFFGIKDSQLEDGRRMVKTSSGIEVQLEDDQPDEFAEGIARAFLTGKATMGYFDEETGKFVSKDLE